MSEKTTILKKILGHLFIISLKISHPLYHLQIIRDKIETRGFQSFDKEDLLNEINNMRHITREINSELLRLHDLLKQ